MDYRYLLLLGGNLGDVRGAFATAIDMLENLGHVACVSALYGSHAWGFEADEPFTNQVVELVSNLAPLDMLDNTQHIERSLGRTEKSSGGVYHSRPIDIDLLYCNSMVVSSPRLTLPHPRLHLRRFTLVPLAEKWPLWQHPLLSLSSQQLLSQCPDKGEVWML